MQGSQSVIGWVALSKASKLMEGAAWKVGLSLEWVTRGVDCQGWAPALGPSAKGGESKTSFVGPAILVPLSWSRHLREGDAKLAGKP